jgi:hypothetical protein
MRSIGADNSCVYACSIKVMTYSLYNVHVNNIKIHNKVAIFLINIDIESYKLRVDLQGYNKMDGLNTLPSSSSREGGELGGTSQVE